MRSDQDDLMDDFLSRLYKLAVSWDYNLDNILNVNVNYTSGDSASYFHSTAADLDIIHDFTIDITKLLFNTISGRTACKYHNPFIDINITRYANQPYLMVTMHHKGVTGVLTPKRDWKSYESAVTSDMWDISKHSPQEVMKAVDLCLISRFRKGGGISGTATRCDSCIHQLSCLKLNW